MTSAAERGVRAATSHDGAAPTPSEARSDRALLRRILAEARPFHGRLALLFVLSLAATPLALLGPVPLKIAVDSVLGSDPLPAVLAPLVPAAAQGSTTALLVLAAVLQVLVVAVVEVQGAAAQFLQTTMGENLTLRFRARLLSHLQRLSFTFHETRGSADSLYRIQHDAPALQQVAVQSLVPMVCSGVMLVSMLYVMVRLDPQLALVAVAISPLLYAGARSFRLRLRPGYRRVKRLESSALGVAQEVLGAFRVVKAYGREDHESERFLDRSSESAQLRIRLALAERLFEMLVRLITAVGTAAVIYIGVRNVQAGRLSLGELLMVLSYLGQLYTPLRGISRRVTGLQKHLASTQRAFEILDQTPEVRDRPDARPLHRARGALRFDDVGFAYGDDPPVLRHLSFEIPAGAKVGIVGPTGSGKTTLVSLISRLYDPIEGRILLDGVDLRDYRLEDLRSQFAIMLQEPLLFSTSIAENIAYARPEAGRAQIEAAAQAAGAHGFIAELPHGYETLVGERGMRLSGGERQRISLARAFLKDAPLLILDEPTSSVDVATEALIMEELGQLMKDRTTLMIAHRTSTLESCDRVLRLEGGGVELRPSPGRRAGAPG